MHARVVGMRMFSMNTAEAVCLYEDLVVPGCKRGAGLYPAFAFCIVRQVLMRWLVAWGRCRMGKQRHCRFPTKAIAI